MPRILSTTTLAALLIATPVLAQMPPEPPATKPAEASDAKPADAPDVKPSETPGTNQALLDGLKNFGFTVGYAYQCQGAAERTAMGTRVLNMANLIVRYFGTEAAFMFTGAFGYGSGHPVDKAKCQDYITKWQESMRKYLPE